MMDGIAAIIVVNLSHPERSVGSLSNA